MTSIEPDNLGGNHLDCIFDQDGDFRSMFPRRPAKESRPNGKVRQIQAGTITSPPAWPLLMRWHPAWPQTEIGHGQALPGAGHARRKAGRSSTRSTLLIYGASRRGTGRGQKALQASRQCAGRGNRSSRATTGRAEADNAGSDWFFLNGKAGRWSDFVSNNRRAGLTTGLPHSSHAPLGRQGAGRLEFLGREVWTTAEGRAIPCGSG